MNFEVIPFPIHEHLLAGQQPIVLLDRPFVGGVPDAGRNVFLNVKVARTGVFYTATSDLLQPEIQWALTEKGEKVRVPVFAYRTLSPNFASLVGTGVQLGLKALENLGKTRGAPESAYLLLADEVHSVDGGYRFYLGLTFRY